MRKHQSSISLYKRAEKLFPGGVNSPVRAFRAVGGEPPIIARGNGSRLWDVDGNEYIDYVSSWGPMILGHTDPDVVEAINRAAQNGTSFGASTAAETELAELVTAAFPSIEMMRFVSSGTEAAMSAIRLARAFTNRKYIVKFEGCYHGHADSLLVKAGSGVATLGIPGSAGVLEEQARFTLALPFNSPDAVEAAFSRYSGQIAAIIVEPVVGNMGCVPPREGYLQKLRELTRTNGSLLVFDEVITGFRMAFGGAQELYGVTPDLTILGKILGGGLPVGAYGGRADIMRMVAPLGPVYQAGTLSGNPLAMAAGIATLSRLKRDSNVIYVTLEKNSSALVRGVSEAARQHGVQVVSTRVGSMFTWFFQAGEIRNYEDASRSNTAEFAQFHRGMLERGVYLPPSQFEAVFLSTAHTTKDIDKTVEAARSTFAALHNKTESAASRETSEAR
ncbi:MAG TPA: glutamate-1-semialdehyde 2,1-aminomutase [Terriglobales bacterium]|nr:glutamate-1-semialdehyde 2,1-aminomutase [Terriglobales bacterium]